LGGFGRAFDAHFAAVCDVVVLAEGGDAVRDRVSGRRVQIGSVGEEDSEEELVGPVAGEGSHEVPFVPGRRCRTLAQMPTRAGLARGADDSLGDSVSSERPGRMGAMATEAEMPASVSMRMARRR
jgi:hypothetical protein